MTPTHEPRARDLVAYASAAGLLDFYFGEDVDSDEEPAALEDLEARGTWRVWTKAGRGERLPLEEAIPKLVALKEPQKAKKKKPGPRKRSRRALQAEIRRLKGRIRALQASE